MQKSKIMSTSPDSASSHYVRYAPSTILKAGIPAPDFSLHTTPDQEVSLSEFRGRPVILVFYPADFSPVCGDEMTLFNEILPEFEKYSSVLFGVSVDGVWCHLAFSKDRKLRFPLLSDFEPKGEVAREYGVYRREDGISERAIFVIDKDGIIRWSYISPIGINPGANGVLNALESLNTQKSELGEENRKERHKVRAKHNRRTK